MVQLPYEFREMVQRSYELPPPGRYAPGAAPEEGGAQALRAAPSKSLSHRSGKEMPFPRAILGTSE